jgi:hypothetical protein
MSKLFCVVLFGSVVLQGHPESCSKVLVGMQHRRSWLFYWLRCKFTFRGPETPAQKTVNSQ